MTNTRKGLDITREENPQHLTLYSLAHPLVKKAGATESSHPHDPHPSVHPYLKKKKKSAQKL